MSDNYQNIKGNIITRLNKLPKPLEIGKINESVDAWRLLLESPIDGPLSAWLMNENINLEDAIEDNEWEKMVRELESYFDVEVKEGYIVQGAEQKERDTTWWSLKEKLKNENYYYNKYVNHLSNSLPSTVVDSIDEATDVVMNHIGNPQDDAFTRYGMVVGHVQSGKTANYSGLICKAADAGYKFIVVIAGGMNNLRNQTQERINEGFIGRDLNQRVGVGLLGEYDSSKVPISLTTKSRDFNKLDADRSAQGSSFDNVRSPIIIVIKKNSSTLTNVIKWLQGHYKQTVANHAMLLIDDESDYASINTKNEDDPTQINLKIRTLLNMFQKSAYVAYTATPFANIFIDHNVNTDKHGKDLFPDDFIYALNAPTNYFGAEKIFMADNNKHVVFVDDYLDVIPMPHKKDYRLPYLPDSLEEAIRLFILNVSIRYLRKQIGKNNSMLIHITRFTDVHKNVYMLVNEYLNELKKQVIAFGKLSNSSNQSIGSLKETFNKYYSNLGYDWKEVIEQLTDILSSNDEHNIRVFEVHSGTVTKFEYRKDVITNAIVVGGTSLSRGFTLEGLSVSYFLRSTIFYDTLMQMGRWFGYREGYEDLCKIYMTETMYSNFRTIVEATSDLIEDLREMSQQGMTPRDFGLAVQHHPDSGLQVTARNKLKSADIIDFEMKLDGHLKETSWIPKDADINVNNTRIIVDLINNLINRYGPNENRIWRNIDKSEVRTFLESFTVYQNANDELGIKNRMPIKFIKEYVEKVSSKWDIAIFSGEGNQIEELSSIDVSYQNRKIIEKNGYYEFQNRQVSSGDAELISILDQSKFIGKSKTEVKSIIGLEDKNLSAKKRLRQHMERPLLMLHLVKGKKYLSSDEIPGVLAAFGISFPGGIESNSRNIKLQVNTVYIEKELEGEYSDD